MARRYIYKDYRGRFISKAKYEKSARATRHLIYYGGHREQEISFTSTVVIRDLSDVFDYEDFDGETDVHEAHGTGDTGRRKK